MKRILLLTLLLSATAFGKSACDADAEKFCPGTEPGKGQLANCLKDYLPQLTPACSKELKEYAAKTAKVNPCYLDLADYCRDIPVGPKLELCLLKNESKLSSACAADFRKKKPRLIVKNECAQDIVTFCYPEVPGPEGAINKCLIDNRTKLTPFCQKNIDRRIETFRKKNPCFDDTQKHCGKAVKVIDIHECLEKKIPSLTPQCQKIVKDEVKNAQSNPCYKDLMRHCRPNISPDDQNRCLIVNEKELSSACRQFRVQKSKKLESMVTDCEPDRLKLCKAEPMRDGRVAKCLRKNKDSLSPACKSHF